MKRPTQLVALTLVAIALIAPSAYAKKGRYAASYTKHTYAATDQTPARDYYLYVPAGRPAEPRPLLVFLHGCNMTADATARMYGFLELADAAGFVVAFPDQVVAAGSSAPLADGNGIGCWNWFLPDDQSRDAGEPGALAGITREVMAAQAIDPDRVYVAGVSAGADMAVILGANYPDLYAAVGAVAGCAYRTCGDETGALTNAAMGEHARVMPMFVENGTADTLNNMTMAGGLVTSWLGADDLADGGADGSIDDVPDRQATYGTDQSPAPPTDPDELLVDACIHDNTLTCPGGVVGFQDTYPYTVLGYDDADGCDVLDFWVIHGMQHAYPDTPGGGAYTDPLGPDITTALWTFLAAHPMNGSCVS